MRGMILAGRIYSNLELAKGSFYIRGKGEIPGMFRCDIRIQLGDEVVENRRPFWSDQNQRFR